MLCSEEDCEIIGTLVPVRATAAKVGLQFDAANADAVQVSGDVFLLRQALDNAAENWDLPAAWRERARQFCRAVKIVVSGGFTPEKIDRFERLKVPVDIYAVGSALFDNHGPTVTDFTADVVRGKIDGEWVNMAKVGRTALDNPDLERVW